MGHGDTRQPGPAIMLGQTIAERLTEQETLDIEGIDRLYLDACQPYLQAVGRLRQHRVTKVASTLLIVPISQATSRGSRDSPRPKGPELSTTP